MTPTEPLAPAPPASADLRERVDDDLRRCLASARDELRARDPRSTLLVDEIARLIAAGGKRLRPAFCYWGYRASGAPDGDPIVRAAAGLELLHTMALIHDDLMDGSTDRRGVPVSARQLARIAVEQGLPVPAERFGVSAAILAGDLAAVLADRCLLGSGFGPDALVAGLDHYHRMRTDMAAGQFLDVAGLTAEPAVARRAAGLKGGIYTVEGPLMIGAALAGAEPPTIAALVRFGSPVSEAFQLRDDLRDGEGNHGATPEEVNALVAQGRAALDPDLLAPEAVAALDALAERVVMA